MPSITNVAAIAATDAIVDLIDAGTADANGDLIIYGGTPPATVETALAGNTVLAQVELQNPAFDAAADGDPGGVAALLGVPLSDLAIDATGTATFARFRDRDNGAVIQVSISATGGGGELQLNSTALQIGATFTVTAFVFTMPEA